MRRRHVLRSFPMVGVWPLAGCLEDAETSTPSNATSEETPSTTSVPSYAIEGVKEFPTTKPEVDVECGDDVLEPVERPYEAHVQADKGVEVWASAEHVTIGERVTFSLRNTTSEGVTVGNIHKYNIQRKVDGDWEWIFQTPEYAWYDDAEYLLPGAGFDWSFTFSQEGLERSHAPADVSYLVCSTLEPGTYRFVYFGAFDTPIGTEFSVGTT